MGPRESSPGGGVRGHLLSQRGSSGFSVGNSVPADRRVTPPTELTGGPRRVCPRQAAPAVLPSRTRSGGSRSRVGPDDGSPSQQGFTPRRGERSSGALDREGTGCRQLGAGRLGQRAVGAPLRPWSDPGQVTHGEPGSAIFPRLLGTYGDGGNARRTGSAGTQSSQTASSSAVPAHRDRNWGRWPAGADPEGR